MMIKRISQFLFFIFFSSNIFSQQLVLPGDHPDPSVVKIGETYWASSTTSNWFPAFPILKSKDLIHWQQQGYVFDKIPAWADYYFWAPEITYDKGKVYVYYAAHKKNGNLCVGVASADKPEGPYKDLGPLICQEDGSIDAFPMRDENGKLYLVWKEDANSIGKPTPIWAMQMNEERTALFGEKKELFRNTEGWEGNLVEGVSMIKQGKYFYAFYAAAGCCGVACSYGVGVARSENLLGPWEKYGNNPLITSTGKWTCPGHGTSVEKNGRHYFMYHAYDKASTIFTGRQGLLIEYKFLPDEWVQFIKEKTPRDVAPAKKNFDDFNKGSLLDYWQWSIFQNIKYKIINGSLRLSALPAGAYIGQKVTAANYFATSNLGIQNSSASSGIGIIGDDKNYISAFYNKGKINCIVLKDGKEQIVAEKVISSKKDISLRVQVSNSKDLYFYYSDNGKSFALINKNAIDGSFLPPWDRGLRAGMLSKGTADQKAVFKNFELSNR